MRLLRGGKHVAEEAVHQHMHVSPVQFSRAVKICIECPLRIKPDECRVRPDRLCRQVHLISETSERRAQEAHFKEHFRPLRIPYSISKIFQPAALFHETAPFFINE